MNLKEAIDVLDAFFEGKTSVTKPGESHIILEAIHTVCEFARPYVD